MRLNRQRSGEGVGSESGDALTLADYGYPDLPAFSWDSLPGTTTRDKAWAYLEALGLEPSAERGMVLWRVECALDDWQRMQAGRRTGSRGRVLDRHPSFEDEILDGGSGWLDDP